MPTIPDRTPAWLKPENASVFDSYWTRIARVLGQAIGADDPAGTLMGVATPLTVLPFESRALRPLSKLAGRVTASTDAAAEGARKAGLLDKIARLHQELGHPWGDRDDFAAFVDTDPADLTETAIRSVLKELQDLRPARPRRP